MLAKQKKVEVDNLDITEALNYLSMNLGVRFIWTKEKGFIDTRHAFRAAAETNQWWITALMVIEGGEIVEEGQAGTEANYGSFQSSFSVEDLVSNKAGVEFHDFLPSKASELPQAFETYVREKLGGPGKLPPRNIMSALDQIYNFGYTPVLDPNDKKVLTSGDGIKYVSSGSALLDIKRLNIIRTWRQEHVMPMTEKIVEAMRNSAERIKKNKQGSP